MRNERLIANAGSGKTHALTTRMIHLLAQEIEPRKIAALTFTRKAAGEFLSAVFVRLAEAALNPQKLDELRQNESLAQIDADRCQSMIQKLALQLGFLGMGTIDSLFARIARAFPLESGLAEDFSIAAEAQIDAAREKTLAEIFAKESNASLADFIDLVRRITRNQGERDVFNRLLAETQNLHEKFLETPANVTWGDAAAIWPPARCEVFFCDYDIKTSAAEFRSQMQMTSPDLAAEFFDKWSTWLAKTEACIPGTSTPPALKEFFVKLQALKNEAKTNRPMISNGQGSPKNGRIYFDERLLRLRQEILGGLMKTEFESLLARSRSLHAFMRKFEEVYSRLVRSTGLVTFGDITDSLARKANPQTQEGEIWRNSVAYRTDQKFDHWLLDEFQDTSRPQWKILKTFIDEVVMDPEGQRSFFYVGDTKQAIYSWRGGDPDLFFEIFDEFNELKQTIHEAEPLAQSWRSCPAILKFVNQVFGDLAPVKTVLEIPEVAAEKWAKAWKPHTASPKTETVKGYAEWVAVPKNDGDNEEEGSATDRKTLAILNQTEPWKRGLSCAVLKPDNNGVAALASLLQSHDIPVAVEGKTNPCVDNPLGAALLATLRKVAFPDDSLSRAISNGFPAASAWGLGDEWNFRKHTLESLARLGYAATIRGWIDSASLEGEPFLKERAAAFLLAAEEFDACRKPGDGILDFLRFVEKRQTQETEASGVVRIMTIHQSKGLGFDMVIASGLDKKGRANDGNRIALGPTLRAVEWGVLLPPKEFAQQDETLRAQFEIDDAESHYGNLCKAYVALTRAKKALYVVTNEVGEKAKNFARHLQLQFGNPAAPFGEADWFQQFPLTPAATAVESARPAFVRPASGTPKPVSPSSFKAESGKGTGFASLSQDAATLGTEVHEALAEIEWLGDKEFPSFPDVSKEAADLLYGFLKTPTARNAFSRQSDNSEAMREKAFDVLLDGKWVSGIFDRVVIQRAPDGSITSAVIYDFKTDHGTPAEIEERYAGQMSVYRQAVSKLLGLDQDSVTSQILRVR
jgi:ATP-dependent exoDNAse (exonuclease V) beta subunit